MNITPQDYDPNRVYEIPLDEIHMDENFNCRGHVNPIDVIELANSIAERGLDSPVFVEFWNQNGKQFRLLAGFRRFKAHLINRQNPDVQKKLGDKACCIKALIKPHMSELDARMLNLSENLHRENLNMKQEAYGIKPFKDAGWSEYDVMEKLRKSRGWVQVRYMLLELPEDIQDEAAAGVISQHEIRQIYSVRHDEELMYNFVRALKDKKILGKKRDVSADQLVAKNEKRTRSETEIFALQDVIRELFGNSLTTIAMGWCAGVTSDLDVHQAIWEKASLEGKFYMIPAGLTGSRAVTPKPKVIEQARSAD
jgi:ParB/RepB/Spo0J family partition protein